MKTAFESDWMEEFADGAARAFWVSAWAQEMQERGKSFPAGTELDDVAPKTPLSAYVKAGELIGGIRALNGQGIYVMAAKASEADGGAYDPGGVEADDFGSALALESLGHGVSWFDDHKSFDIEIPSLEYGPEID